MKHLFLAPLANVWGETTQAVRMAAEVALAGDEAAFVAHPSLRMQLTAVAGQVHWLPDFVGADLAGWLAAVIEAEQPDTLVLADMLTCSDAISTRRLPPDTLDRLGVPIVLIDTWNLGGTGGVLDDYPGRDWPVPAWLASYPRRIVPVPVAAPGVALGCASLPRAQPVTRAERSAVRSDLGIDDRRVVLLTTSPWVHRATNHRVRRMARAVPQLLATYLARLGPDVVALHVGAEPFPWSGVIPGGYVHLPPVPPTRFRELVGAADLVLSPNLPATSNTLALVLGVPVVAVTSALLGAPRPSALDLDPSPALRSWLATQLPLFPFVVWPVSRYRAVAPALHDNPIADVMHHTELLDERRVHDVCSRLLRDPHTRAAAAERTTAWIEAVRALPGPAERLRALAS